MRFCDRCDGGRWWDWDEDTGWRSWPCRHCDGTGLTSDFGTIGTVPEAVGTDSEDLTKHHSHNRGDSAMDKSSPPTQLAGTT